PRVPAHREGAQGVAVVALASRDEMRPPGLADLDEVLPGHLERGLDGLGAARHEVRVRDARRGPRHEVGREFLRDLGREEARVRIGQAPELRPHGLEHVGMAMAETGDRGAAGCVDVVPALAVAQVDALPRDRHGKAPLEVTMENGGHWALRRYRRVAVAGSM